MFFSHAIKFVLFFTFFFVAIYASSEESEENENDDKTSHPKKPFYIIANMANTISEAEEFLAKGANGLEIDVEFSPNGNPKTIHHGNPCFCNRDCSKSENLKDYLEFLRRSSVAGTSEYNPNLALVFLNLKTSSLSRGSVYMAGDKFAEEIIKHLYLEGKALSRVWLILRLRDIRTVPFLRGFRDNFRSSNLTMYLGKFGYSITHFPRPEMLKGALLASGIKGHVWLGTGSSNCKRRTTPQRLIRLASEREYVNAFGNNFVDKIYSWTVDDPVNVRENLRLGIDAIITNKPSTLKTVTNEEEFKSKIRLADVDDLPWKWKSEDGGLTAIGGRSMIGKKDRLQFAISEIDKELANLEKMEDTQNEGSIKRLVENIFGNKNLNLFNDGNEGTEERGNDKLIDLLFHYIQDL